MSEIETLKQELEDKEAELLQVKLELIENSPLPPCPSRFAPRAFGGHLPQMDASIENAPSAEASIWGRKGRGEVR